MNRRAFFAGLALAPLAALGFGKKAVAQPMKLKVELEPVTITLQGEAYSKRSVEELIHVLNDARAEGRKAIIRNVGRSERTAQQRMDAFIDDLERSNPGNVSRILRG